MFQRRLKAGYFILEGINAYATAYYFYFLFFFMRDQFGFSKLENLAISALNGFLYMFAAWYGGRYSQRRGYFSALRLGFSIMGAALLAGCFASSVAGQVAVLCAWTLGMCFTWPTLEAMVSEQETRRGLQQMIGIYNLVWAGASGLAYFFGGILHDHLGPGSVFWFPALLHGVQLVLLAGLQRMARRAGQERVAFHPEKSDLALSPPVSSRRFLQMAWISNPFAYVAINTVVAVVPAIAQDLRLTTSWAGVFCSTWLFSRFLTFSLLWRWSGWHYRASWLIGAYLGLIASFCGIMLIPHLWVIFSAQLLFGFSVGLIYYSSLYYSMDVGETKGEHGGWHEAAIGSGIFMGPAVGAASLYFFPRSAQSGTVAVAGLLLLGLLTLLALRRRPGPAAD